MNYALIQSVDDFSMALPDDYVLSKCDYCQNLTLWYKKEIIHPRKVTIEAANQDLPDAIKNLYNEASLTLTDSPRAAAALLRLALQLLLKELGGEGKNIDSDIKTIVSKGVDPQVQKAMDIVRVFGNNGAHPGQIQLTEEPSLVNKMFELINFIANKMITQQKEINDLFEDLPKTVKEGIKHRDRQHQGDSND